MTLPHTSRDQNTFDRHSCSAPEVLTCFNTTENFVNVHSLRLVHGTRYVVCVLAPATTLVYEKFSEALAQFSGCSDGITADHNPPKSGHIYTGWQQQDYQASKEELMIRWSGFTDVEEYGFGPYHSGISRYQYAIGTTPYGVDIVGFTDVTVSNYVIQRGLSLVDGHAYYATIKAKDFAGHETVSTSDSVTIDTSPPVITNKQITLPEAYLTSTDTIAVYWSGKFIDETSGILYYDWCIGSKSFACDVTTFARVSKENAESRSLALKEGHKYHITVRAVNGAGLSAIATSLSFTVDATPPIRGHVYETTNHNKEDIDYQTRTDELVLRWEGFHDPHSRVTSYTVNVGTCCACQEVLQRSSVGVITELRLTDLSLSQGVKYHTNIQACDAAALCTTSCSDGIIVDTTPPVGGIVYDGVFHEDLDYQNIRKTMSASWFNFHDAQSGISHYTWQAGTARGADDILSATEVHGQQSARAELTSPLPSNKQIYITVTAYNHAGLHVAVTSDGFRVDTSRPTFSRKIDLLPLGTIHANTLVWRTAVGVAWQVEDAESPIEEQHLSLTTNHNTENSLPDVKVSGSLREYIFPQLKLEDGNRYRVHITSCNAAKLCNASQTEPIIVDNSPPRAGAFAVATAHAANLARHQSGWMTYEQSSVPVIKLAWIGFSDPHSDVTKYYIIVGTKYDANDLGKQGEVEVIHKDGSSYKHEGALQTASVELSRKLTASEQIFVSIQAENKVGLRSEALHGLLFVVPSNAVSGVLDLVRRCQSASCQGHCTCAPGHSRCLTSSCQDVRGNGAFMKYTVYDLLDLSLPRTSHNDKDYSASQCTLAATWDNNKSSQRAASRFEFSVGVKGSAPGTGLLDTVHGRVWFDAGSRTSAVMNIKQTLSMKPNIDYVFHVRAWYDADKYALFTSDGVRTDSAPPEISISRDVEELSHVSHDVDTDYILQSDHVIVSWKNVFRDSQAGISHYRVSISKHPGGEDVKAFTTFSASTDTTKIQNLQLEEGVRYYSNVVAYNMASLFSIATSDGFIVDLSAPSAGEVWDGAGLRDLQYQSSTRHLAAAWRGFSDAASYLHHYDWCVGTSPGSADVMPCRDVGLVTSQTKELQNPLSSGRTYYSTVYAIDAAGRKSAPAFSNGITIDTTPPITAAHISYGTNVLSDPSFEQGQPSAKWNVKGKASLRQGSAHLQPRHGRHYIQIAGELSQKAWTIPGKTYRLVAYSALSSPPPSTGSGETDVYHEATIHVPGSSETFLVEHRLSDTPGDANDQLGWKKHVLYFSARNTSSVVEIRTDASGGMISLDDLSLQIVDASSSTAQKDAASVHIDVDIRDTFSTLRAHWHFTDPESPVTNYMWAVGTVKGGTQLQGFSSTRMRSFAQNDRLILAHGAYVHVTVIAENAADLRSMVHSKPVLIDRTPPVLCCIRFDKVKEDVIYQTTKIIRVYWNVSDAETEVTGCQWAIGLVKGSSSVKGFEKTGTLSSASADLTSKLTTGQVVYVTVRCKNARNLESSVTSHSLAIITSPPITRDAQIKLLTPSITHFATRLQHQSQNDVVAIGWTGIEDASGIDFYEIAISETAVASPSWRRVRNTGQEFALLQGLALTEYQTYAVQLRATNRAGLVSPVVMQNFTIETRKPICIIAQLRSSWLNKWSFQMDWNGVFSANSSLIYEVSIGSRYGGSDVLLWRETEDSTMTVTGVDSRREHFVTITAVNSAALYTTKTFVVSYS